MRAANWVTQGVSETNDLKGYNKTGSSQVGAISKARKYSKNNYWKHLEKLFFSKKIFLKIFFRKKYFFRKSHNAEKLKKRPFRLIKRFYKPKTSKKCKGLPFDRIRKFSKKKSHSAEKNPKGGPFGLTCCTFGSIKILWFSARIEPPLSGFRNLVEDEQQNTWTNCKKWTIQSEIVGWKRKKTTHCNSRAFFLKGKGAD